jgi:hypothetical protein
MTRRYDLSIHQGEDWSVTVPVLDIDNQPLALVGYTAKAQIRDPYGDVGDTALYEWTVAAGNMDLSTGQISLEVPAATSAAWTWTFGRWSLELTAPGGAVTRLVEGAVLVDPETVFVDPA